MIVRVDSRVRRGSEEAPKEAAILYTAFAVVARERGFEREVLAAGRRGRRAVVCARACPRAWGEQTSRGRDFPALNAVAGNSRLSGPRAARRRTRSASSWKPRAASSNSPNWAWIPPKPRRSVVQREGRRQRQCAAPDAVARSMKMMVEEAARGRRNGRRSDGRGDPLAGRILPSVRHDKIVGLWSASKIRLVQSLVFTYLLEV